jgi:hypothetical protein
MGIEEILRIFRSQRDLSSFRHPAEFRGAAEVTRFPHGNLHRRMLRGLP